MPPRTLSLSAAQRTERQPRRDHAPHSYLRQRADALLKMAAGHAAHQVAASGWLRRRQPDTLYRWLNRYLAEGVAGLSIRPGRGRKPVFSPTRPRQRSG